MNSVPENGSCRRCSSTKAARLSAPRRKSTGLLATKIRTPVRNGDHVAALVARSTVVSVTASIPGGTRTVAAPSTISIMREPPGPVGTIGASECAQHGSTTTGVKPRPVSLLSRSARCRACRRHSNNCCGVSPCRRATAETVPPSQLSAMICAFLLRCPGTAPAGSGEHLDPAHRIRLRFGQKLSVRGSNSGGKPSPISNRREGGISRPLTVDFQRSLVVEKSSEARFGGTPLSLRCQLPESCDPERLPWDELSS